ncbi:MAG: SprB repeat-containing protein [Bacteroidales bacterium]|nr:SprB repeat-containing protein [Bacteroidales bacterium]
MAITISGDDEICAGESTTLTASGATNYQWNTTATIAAITVSPTSTATYTVTGTNQYGCTGTASVTVTVRELPTVTISGTTTINHGQSATLTATGATSYQWNTNDNTADITVSPTSTTTYTVTGTNQYGCTGTASVTVEVNSLAPTVITSNVTDIASTTATCGGNVTHDGGAAVTSRGVCWSTSQNPTVSNSHTEDGSGTGTFISSITGLSPNTTYYVRAYATNEVGTAYGEEVSFRTECNNVEVTITVSDNDTVICEGGQYTLTATAYYDEVLGDAVYTWTRNGEEIVNAHGATLTESDITVDGDITTYTYTVVATLTASGCQSVVTDSSTITVTVLPNPTVVISGDPVICGTGNNATSVQLTANVNDHSDLVDGFTYEWRLFNNTLGFTTNELDTVLEPSVDPYIFQVIVHNENGCTTVSATYNVLVNAAPVVNAEAVEADYCVVGTTTLVSHIIDRNAENLTYQWLLEGDTIPGANEETYVTPNDLRAGTYTYTVLVYQTTSDCIGSADVVINVHADPIITDITVSNAVVCDGGAVVVTANATLEDVLGEATYTWYKNGTEMVGITANTFTDYPTVVDNDITEITYSAIVTLNASGCTSEEVAAPVVTVNPHATVSVVAEGSLTVCDGGNVTLTANVDPADTYTYQWYLDNQPVGYDTNVYVAEGLAARETPYMIHVVVESAPGCITSTMDQAVAVNVHTVPVVTISGDTSICAGGSTTLTASGANSYVWSTGDTTASITVSPTATTTYTVTGTNQYGCTGTAIVTVTVHELPTVSISGSTAINHGQSATLTASGAASYQWSTNATTAAITVTPASTTTYTVTGTNQYGCTGTASVTVVVNSLAPTVITSNVTDIASISATCGGNVTNDGGAAVTARGVCWSTAHNPTIADNHTTNGTGTGSFTSSLTGLAPNTTYYVRAYATNSAGTGYGEEVSLSTFCDTHNVAISGAQNVCQYDAVALTAWVDGDMSAPATTNYYWYMDGQFRPYSYRYQYEENYIPIGTYEYRVEVADSNGCSSWSNPFYVTVYETPVTHIIANTDTVCIGGEVTLTATLGNSNLDNIVYRWYENDPTIEANRIVGADGSTCSVIPNATATYYVQVYSESGGNHDALCTSMDDFTVVVVDAPSVAISGNTVLCAGESTTLTASGMRNYSWNTGLNGESMTVTPTSTTTYTVTGSNGSGCSVIHSVTVSVTPQSEVVIQGNPYVCEYAPIMLNAWVNGELSTPGTTSYEWYLDGMSYVAPNIYRYYFESESYLDPGITEIKVKVTDGNGCIAWSEPFQVVVYDAPEEVHVIASDDTICFGNEVVLRAALGNGNIDQLHYQWYRNSIAEANKIHGANSPVYTTVLGATTTYYVEVYSELDDNRYPWCTATDSFTVVVVENPMVSVSGNIAISSGQNTTLTATGADTYQWSNGDMGTNISVRPNNTANYTVTGTTAYGCIGTRTVTVFVDEPAVRDTIPPYFITIPQSVMADCDGEGNRDVLFAWLNSLQAVDDYCGTIEHLNFYYYEDGYRLPFDTTSAGLLSDGIHFRGWVPECGNAGHYQIVWEAMDTYGNAAYVTEIFHITDTRSPMFTQYPINQIVECGYNPALFTDWVESMDAMDVCSGVTVTHTETFTPDCGSTGVYHVTWTATDGCGNSRLAMENWTVVDMTSPQLVNMPDAFDALPTSNDCEFLVPDFRDTVLAHYVDNGSGLYLYSQSPIAGTVITNSRNVTISFSDSCENSSTANITLYVPNVPKLKVRRLSEAAPDIANAVEHSLRDTLTSDDTNVGWEIFVDKDCVGCDPQMHVSLEYQLYRLDENSGTYQLMPDVNVHFRPQYRTFCDNMQLAYCASTINSVSIPSLYGNIGSQHYDYFNLCWLSPDYNEAYLPSGYAHTLSGDFYQDARANTILISSFGSYNATGVGDYKIVATLNKRDGGTENPTMTWDQALPYYMGGNNSTRGAVLDSVEIMFHVIAHAQVPTVVTALLSNIAPATATGGGIVVSNGGAAVTARGVCWSTSPNPTINDSHTTDGTGTGNFVSSLTNLTPNTTYYIRAYATNRAGTGYGQEVTFTTNCSGFTPFVAISGNRYICEYNNFYLNAWVNGGQNTPATTTYTWYLDGQENQGTDSYRFYYGNILPPDQVPYQISVKIEDVETGCSAWSNPFEVLVYESPAAHITAPVDTVCHGGMLALTAVIDNNGPGYLQYRWYEDSITESHRIWGATGPVLTVSADATTTYYLEVYSTIDSYVDPQCTSTDSLTVVVVDAPSVTISGDTTLCEGDTATLVATGMDYYVWSTGETGATIHVTPANATTYYVTGSNGYGCTATNDITVAVVGHPLVAIEGNHYVCEYEPITMIAWVDGDIAPLTTTYHWYLNGNPRETAQTYRYYFEESGPLPPISNPYQYSVMILDENGCATWSDPFEIDVYEAPVVHLSTSHDTIESGEEVVLTAVLESGSAEAMQYRWYRNSMAESNQILGANASVYRATPDITTVYYVEVHSSLDYSYQPLCTSIDSVAVVVWSATLPTVTTSTVTNIASTTAICGGNVTNDGGAAITARGVCWSTSQNPTVSNSHTTNGTGTGSFTSSLTGLAPNTTYYVRAYATNEVGTSYGEEVSFTTACTDGRPEFVTLPFEVYVECDGSGNQSDLLYWLEIPQAVDGNGNPLVPVPYYYNGYTFVPFDATASGLMPDGIHFYGWVEQSSCSGYYQIQWRAEDACGNVTSAMERFNVRDYGSPYFTRTNVDATFNIDSEYEQLQEWLAYPMAFDECSQTNTTVSYMGDFTTNNFSPGTYNVTWLSSDECGNTSTFSASLTIIDTTAPQIRGALEQQYIYLNEVCEYTIPNAYTDVNELPNSISITDFNLVNELVFSDIDDPNYDSYPIVVERSYIVTDSSGNTSSFEERFIVVDTTEPYVWTQNLDTIVFFIDADGFYTLPLAFTSVVELSAYGGVIDCTLLDTLIHNSTSYNFDSNTCGYNFVTREYYAVDRFGNVSVPIFEVFELMDTISPWLDVTSPVCNAEPSSNPCEFQVPDLSNYVTTHYVDNWGMSFSSFSQSPPAGCIIYDTTLAIVVFEDLCGNSTSIPIQVNVPGPLLIDGISMSSALCYGENNGSISIEVSGGTPNYTFSYGDATNTIPTSLNAVTFPNIAAGSYIVTVTDATGCIASETITVTQPTELILTSFIYNNHTCDNVPVILYAELNGGYGDYTITATLLDDSMNPVQELGSANNNYIYEDAYLPGGNYYIVFHGIDANGCYISDTSDLIIIYPSYSFAQTERVSYSEASTNGYDWYDDASHFRMHIPASVFTTPDSIYIFSDSLFTINGCDSIYTVYLSVSDAPFLKVRSLSQAQPDISNAIRQTIYDTFSGDETDVGWEIFVDRNGVDCSQDIKVSLRYEIYRYDEWSDTYVLLDYVGGYFAPSYYTFNDNQQQYPVYTDNGTVYIPDAYPRYPVYTASCQHFDYFNLCWLAPMYDISCIQSIYPSFINYEGFYEGGRANTIKINTLLQSGDYKIVVSLFSCTMGASYSWATIPCTIDSHSPTIGGRASSIDGLLDSIEIFFHVESSFLPSPER